MGARGVIEPGRIALVTGAASGIGRAMCLRFAASGMDVALVDLPGDALEEATEEVATAASGDGQTIDAFPTDLADPGQVDKLCADALARLGKVNFLANNAVTRIGRGHDAPLAEWRTAMDVNFWAPVCAVRAFLPHMLAMDEPGMILNVGSKQGITKPPGHPIYNICKSALITYTESLQHELRNTDGNAGDNRITAHLLIPGWTTTAGRQHQPGAWLPDQVVAFMCEALDRGDFYILCQDDEVTTEMDHRRILWAAGDIVENRPPLSRWHPDFAEAAKKACS